MRIRRAEEKDIPKMADLLLQVCRVHQQGRPDLIRAGARKYTDDQLREILKDESRPVLVAVDEADVVTGYAFCVLQQTDGSGPNFPIRTLYIDDLCVDENCRGQHIGTTLYEAVLALAREHECYNVTLHVWNCNEPAMRFYDGLGLKPRKMELETIL